MRLLLVDDDVAIQGFLKRALVESGYQVDAASNAKTAEMKALEGIYDAFIIDLGLRVGKGGPMDHFQIPKLELLQSIASCIQWSGTLPLRFPVKRSAMRSSRLLPSISSP